MVSASVHPCVLSKVARSRRHGHCAASASASASEERPTRRRPLAGERCGGEVRAKWDEIEVQKSAGGSGEAQKGRTCPGASDQGRARPEEQRRGCGSGTKLAQNGATAAILGGELGGRRGEAPRISRWCGALLCTNCFLLGLRCSPRRLTLCPFLLLCLPRSLLVLPRPSPLDHHHPPSPTSAASSSRARRSLTPPASLARHARHSRDRPALHFRVSDALHVIAFAPWH